MSRDANPIALTAAGARPRPRRRHVVIGAVVLVLLTLAVLTPPALGVRTLEGEVPGAPPESADALEAQLDEVLAGVVIHGEVDYARLASRERALARIVGALGRYGPDTQPDAFDTDDAKFAYYINAYNTLVLHAVLEREVRTSVHEVRGLIEPVDGFGFFWSQHFRVDGERINLYELEHDVLRERFADARLHAAINCASRSCPPLRWSAYHAATLEQELAEAAAAFAAEPHVRIDHDRGTVALNPIYEWYAEDFETHARALGETPTALGWVAAHAPDSEPVRRAIEEDYQVTTFEYDWSLNGSW